jgi:TonB family protein
MYRLLLLILLPVFLYAQDGVIKNYYPDGKLESEITFFSGVREGEAKFYNPDGFLKEERYYINGRVDGLVKVYGDSGKLKELVNLEYGRRNGPVSLFNEKGEYYTDIYFEDGKRMIIPETVEEPEKLVAESEEVKEEKKEPVKQQVKRPKSQTEMPVPPSIMDEDKFKDDPAYYLSVEVMPEPYAGPESIQRRLRYPSEAIKRKIEGTVKVLTFIDQYGVVEKAEVIEGIGYGCDEAAQLTVFYTKFKPGLLRGRPVKVQMIIPVEFKLASAIKKD